MTKLEKWLKDLQKKGFEFVSIEQILLQISKISRENVLRRNND